MTLAKNLIVVASTENLLQTVTIFMEQNIGSVLVSEGDVFLGIITQSDISKAYYRQFDITKTKNKAIVQKTIHSCDEDDTIEKVAHQMFDEKIHHVLVMKNGKITGLISSIDLLKPLVQE
eukprot:gene288-6703_t